MVAVSQSLFSIGEIYSAFLIWVSDPYLKKLDWRWLVCMGAIPSGVFLVIAIAFLNESPSFLLVKDRVAEAKQVVKDLFEANGYPNAILDFRPAPKQTKPLGALDIVFGKRLLYTTLVVCFSCFNLNFLFYGGLYAFPQVLPHMKLHLTPAANLLLGAIASIFGFIIGTVAGMHLPRKVSLMGYLVLVSGFTLTFVSAGYDHLVPEFMDDGSTPIKLHPVRGLSETLVLVGLMGMKITTAMGFMLVYVYSAEIYPTVARTTGNALCIAFGRLGAICCPAAYEHLFSASGGHAIFFHVMLLLCGINGILVLFLPFETKGQLLQDHEEEGEPLVKAP